MELSDVLNKFCIKTDNFLLYERAFTHPSVNADLNTKHIDYERLEFLGDSVIGLVIAELAFTYKEDMDEGELTKLKSNFVSTFSLSNYARKFHFDKFIKVGNSFDRNIYESDNILENVFEAFFGALYLDKGFSKAHNVLTKIFKNDVINYCGNELRDYKSKLQEEIQSEHRESVVYKVVNEYGPAHKKHFVVAVFFDGIELGRGEGQSKKAAEQEAAKSALQKEASK